MPPCAPVLAHLAPHLLAPHLLDDKTFLAFWQKDDVATLHNARKGELSHFVDAMSLACPLPLLKLKMALKETSIGNQVYLIATDGNSERDIGAFCQHMGYTLHTLRDDTILHLLITKNC